MLVVEHLWLCGRVIVWNNYDNDDDEYDDDDEDSDDYDDHDGDGDDDHDGDDDDDDGGNLQAVDIPL